VSLFSGTDGSSPLPQPFRIDFTKTGALMIEVITGVRPGESKLVDEAMRIRHTVFVEEKGWSSLRREDGRDIDQFDTPATVYHIAVVNGEVAGGQRFNQTTRPHLLSDVHPGLCARPYIRAPHCWEWSRYSVARKFRRDDIFCDVASTLLIAALEWGEANGVTRLVLEFHPLWITRFLELDFTVKPLGLPQVFDGEPAVAVELGWSEHTYQRMLELRGIHPPVLNSNRETQARVA
jgi:acyl-homoserine lactone synthase